MDRPHHARLEPLHLLPPSSAYELTHWVQEALEGAQRPELGPSAVPDRLPVGVDDGFAVVGEDGLGAGVIDVEGDGGLGRGGSTSLMDMLSWTMNSRKRARRASLTLLYFFLREGAGSERESRRGRARVSMGGDV